MCKSDSRHKVPALTRFESHYRPLLAVIPHRKRWVALVLIEEQFPSESEKNNQLKKRKMYMGIQATPDRYQLTPMPNLRTVTDA